MPIPQVRSGMLIMPNTAVPNAVWEVAETAEMREVVGLYGKTYHMWQVDRGDQLPLGPPQLMMSFTKDEQVRCFLVVFFWYEVGSSSLHRSHGIKSRIEIRDMVLILCRKRRREVILGALRYILMLMHVGSELFVLNPALM